MPGKIHRNSLKSGHKVLWYEIEEVLGQGGFGITYLAYDPNLEKHVAIKEYLPIELAVREGDFSVHPVTEDRGKQYKWGLDRFIAEARTLSKFKHPNIVHVFSVTEENNTAYMVMEYEAGQSLQEKLKGKRTLEEAELLKILIPILGGLEIVHKAGFIHRDIKPDNIFIREDGSPVLLDFGSARQALGEETKTLTSLVSPGYAPFEQYFSKGNEQGEWTDIYGLGATLYRAITGVAPMDAADRSNVILKTSIDTIVSAVEIGKGKYSERFLKAIDHAIQFRQEDRPQTIKEWKAEFELPEDPIKEAIAIEQKITQPGKTVLARQKERKPIPIKMITSVILLIGLAATFYFREEISQTIQSTKIVSDWQQEKENKLVRQQQAEDEKRLAILEQKRLEQEARRQLVDENRIVEEKKRLEKQARLQQQQQIAYLIKNAEEAMSRGRLVEPDGDNAFDAYLKILKLEPDNEAAMVGKTRVYKELLARAKAYINENKFDDAGHALTQANAIEPDSVEVRLIRVQMGDAKKEAERIAMEEERKRQEEEQRLAEQERQRQAEEEEQRLAEQERQRQAEEERQRLVQEEEEQRLVEQERRDEETRLANLGENEVAKIAENAKTDTSSLNELIRLADLNNSIAQASLGIMYETGKGGLSIDMRTAVGWYEKSAAQGNGVGQAALGGAYINGEGGLPKDERKGRELIEKSAAQGNSQGQASLGFGYDRGLWGLPKDERKAVELYEKSAQQGNSWGQNSLGTMYDFGKGGLAKDLRKARELYEKSAAQGNQWGQNNLGSMYHNGQGGLAKDLRKARELYEKSAAQGNEMAIKNLENLR